jgi:hypothetical protein
MCTTIQRALGDSPFGQARRVPLPILIGAPVDRTPWLGAIDIEKEIGKPMVLHPGHVFQQSAERHRRRMDRLCKIGV